MIEYNSQEKQDSLSHVRFADEELIKTQVLQGEAAQTIIQGKNCSVYKMENETGEGVITRYPVFPGIELLYDDIHMSCGVAHREDPRADLLEINHCRLGRFECEFSDGSAVYLGEGDLAVNVMTNRTRETWFPLSHYHGITIAVDIPVADRVLRQVSEALGEGLYCDLFAMRDRLCACDSCFIMRATESIPCGAAGCGRVASFCSMPFPTPWWTSYPASPRCWGCALPMRPLWSGCSPCLGWAT